MNVRLIITSEKQKTPNNNPRKCQIKPLPLSLRVSRNEIRKSTTKAELKRLREYLVPFNSLMIF